MNKPETREAWLIAATALIRPHFSTLANVDLPDNIQMSCGWPKGRSGGKNKAIGQIFATTQSLGGVFEIFISPVVAESERVLDILVHELCHAAAGIEVGHKKAFGKVARAMLLEGKLTCTTGGESFKQTIARPVIDSIGAYPHSELMAGGNGSKKQTTRMLKCECMSCGYIVRTTQKCLDLGTPICPVQDCDNYKQEMDVS